MQVRPLTHATYPLCRLVVLAACYIADYKGSSGELEGRICQSQDRVGREVKDSVYGCDGRAENIGGT